MRQLVSASQLDRWFQSTNIAAQGLLPHLLRRLARATLPRAEITIQVGDEIGRPGYDGIIDAQSCAAHIPVGKSVWECGVGEPVDKFKEDYEKRKNEPLQAVPAETTFMFVTPHAWQNRDKVAALRRAEGVWRDVRILDNSDLASWLEMCPAVALWLLGEFGGPTGDIETLHDFRRRISMGTQPPLSDQLVIGGRTENLTEFVEWLRDGRSVVFLDDQNLEAAAAFVCCALTSLPEDEIATLEATAVVAKSPAAVDYLAGLGTTGILAIATTHEAAEQLLMRASRSFRAIIPRGHESTVDANEQVIRLDRARAAAISKALIELGVPATRANRIAAESRGHLDIVLSMLRPRAAAPPWSSGVAALRLTPLLFVGHFLPENKPDASTVCEIAGYDEVTLSETIAAWRRPVGPLEQNATGIDVIGRDDVWRRLAPSFPRALIDRFITVASRVLCETDPVVLMSESEKLMAQLKGAPPSLSPQARRGIADAITRLAMLGRSVGGMDGELIADAIVRRIFGPENRQRPDFWVSISPLVEGLAEASPKAFLEAIEAFVDLPEAVAAVFAEPTMFGSSPHTHYLWALERLAWSPDHLSRVILALARLHQVDPGGKLANRPLSSLVGILLPWMAGTAATMRDRVFAFRALFERFPEIGWTVGKKLLPHAGDVAHSTVRPRWRPWADHAPTQPDDGELIPFVDDVVTTLLAAAGHSATRWSTLINESRALTAELRQRVFDSLEASCPDEWPAAEQTLLWDSLRVFIANHRRHATANWALPAAELDRLAVSLHAVEPTDVVLRSHWLFHWHPELELPSELTYEEQLKRVSAIQDDALRSVISSKGLPGVRELAMKSDGVIVGYTLGRVADRALGDSIVESGIRDQVVEDAFSKAAAIAAAVMFSQHGVPWIEATVASSPAWDADARLRLAKAITPSEALWKVVDGWGEELARRYWSTAYVSAPDRESVPTVLTRLAAVGRGFAAVRIAGDLAFLREGEDLNAVPNDALVQLLRDAPSHDLTGEPWAINAGQIGHEVAYLLDLLERRGCDQQTLASIEWLWLTTLEYTHRGPKALRAEVMSDPLTFVQLIEAVFKPKSGDREPKNEQTRGLAQQAFRFLRMIRSVPGCTYESVKDDSNRTADDGDIVFARGVVDVSAFRNWIAQARAAASSIDRMDSCDSQIGEMLAYAPGDPDGSWPARGIRVVVEEISSPALEDGLSVGLYNRRGCHFVQPKGRQEDELADKFAIAAESCADDSPRLAAVFHARSESFRHEAQRNREQELIDEYRDP